MKALILSTVALLSLSTVKAQSSKTSYSDAPTVTQQMNSPFDTIKNKKGESLKEVLVKANQQKRADRIKKEGGTKVGNFLRKSVKKVKEVVKKKTDGEKISSAAQMKKSALKMKKSAMKMNEGFDKLPADVQAKIKKNKK